MAIAHVSTTTSASNSFSVNVTSGTNLLVVVRVGDFMGNLSGTFNGDALTLITNGDAFVQAAYIKNPDVGNFTLSVATGTPQQVVALQYSGVDAYVAVNPSSGAGGVAHAAQTTTTAGELLIWACRCTNTSGTAFGSTVERYDNGGSHESWVGDFVAGAAGSYDVGVSTATGASSIAIRFSAAAGGSQTASAAFTAQAASSAVTAVRGHPASAAFTAGSATMAVSAVRGHPASAAFTAGSATMAVSAAVADIVASAAFTAGSATMAVSASRGRTADAAFTAGSATMAVTAVRGHPASAAFTAGSATMAASVVKGGLITAAAFAAQAAVMAVSALNSHVSPGLRPSGAVINVRLHGRVKQNLSTGSVLTPTGKGRVV